MRQPLDPPAIPGATFVRHLGTGGFADVYLFRQQMPQRDVAVKVLRPDSNAQASAAFDAEVNLMAQVANHPSIVSFYTGGIADDGRHYLVMEYCPPPHLGQRSKEHRIPVSQALDVGVRIAGAVETLHQRGIIHRDVKPMNILFTQFGHPVLTDFGIAAQTGSGEESPGGFSVAWAPPEQQDGTGPFGPTIDVYSLAATVHGILTGHSPFEIPGGDNRELSVLNRVLRSPVPAIGRSDVPAELERILSIAMSKDPKRRYQSAREFALALQNVQSSLRLTPTPFEAMGVEAPTGTFEDEEGDETCAAPIAVFSSHAPAPASSVPDEEDDRTVAVLTKVNPAPAAASAPQSDPPKTAPTREDTPRASETDEAEERPSKGFGSVAAGFLLVLLLVGGIAFGVWTVLRGEGTTKAPTQSAADVPPLDGLPSANANASVTGLSGTLTPDGVTFTWDSAGAGTTYLYHVEDPKEEHAVRQTKETSVTVPAVPGRTCLSVAVRNSDGRSSNEAIECVETP